MSDTYRPMSREEIIALDGVDPEPIAVDAEIVDKEEPWVKNHLKSLAVGALSIPTDLLALPGMVRSGANALYRSTRDDTKFLDEFQNELMVKGARDKIAEHVSGIQQAWQQQNPGVTEDELKYATDEYLKSKQFEEFQQSQLSGTAWLQAKARDVIRRTLGDERPESERSWTEGAAEALGGAIVPGPTGWAAKVGSIAAARGGMTAAVAGSKIGRGTLKTAEVLTPLTMPYTPANVALNAAAGIAINQGTSYALGKPTAFTPTPEDQAGVGTLGVIAGGIAAGAAFVAAIKGRTGAALNAGQQSATDAALQQSRALDLTTANPMRQGTAAITGGDPSTITPRSAIEQQSVATTATRGMREKTFDEGSPIDQAIGDIHGPNAQREAERIRNEASDAVTFETSMQKAGELTYNLNAMLRNMPPSESRATASAWLSYSEDAHAQVIIKGLQDDIADLQARINHPQATANSVATLTPKLQELQTNLTRMMRDDPDVRIGTPDVPMADKARIARAFETDQAPHMVAFKNELKRVNRAILNELVAGNLLSAQTANHLFARNPYFAPIIDDPFHGKTGIARVWAQGLAMFRGRPQKTTFSAMYSDPVQKLNTDIFNKSVSGGETRSISPLHPLSAMEKYAQRVFKGKAQTNGRNRIISMLTNDVNGNVNPYVVGKHIEIYENPNAKGLNRVAWIEQHQLHAPWVEQALTEPGVVPQMSHGRMRLWKFADHELAAVLRHDPQQAGAMMNFVSAFTNFFKFWTTGRGNFAFALKGPLYDTPIMILTTPQDRVFGPLSYRARKLGVSSKITRYVPDVSAYASMPYHAIATFIETQAWRMSRYLGQQLSSQHSAFRALEGAMGTSAYHKMLNRALKTASWSEETPSAILRRGGGMRTANSIDNIDTVRNALTDIRDRIPAPLKITWQFYTDIIDALYGSNKRQYFTQNYALMHQKYNGRVPQHVVDQLVTEARNAAGDMTKVPGSKMWRDAEKAFPYLTQTKLGTYHLYRNMAGRETAHYMLPKLSLFMSGVVGSIYYMTYWDDEARDFYWNRTPTHEKWRTLPIPIPEVWMAHYNGTKVPFSRDKIWNLTLPPDLVPIIAGAVSIAQQIGWIPGDATPKPIASDLPNLLADSLTPAMPPIIQAMLAPSGMRLDPQSSETRGGNWIREFGSNFRAGPQSEALTNLGQVTNSQALFLNAVFGAMGSHIALATDIALHAAKYKTEFGPAGTLQPQENAQFAKGLRLATNEVLTGVVSKIPDIPFMWRANEKQTVSTPAWQYVKENDTHLRSIVGMRTDIGNTAMKRRETAVASGGMTKPILTDPVLIKITNDLAAYQSPKGDLGILRKQYADLRDQSRSVSAQYNRPAEWKRNEVNRLVKLQQDNLVQQQMAIKYAEQKIAEIYGAHLAPRLNGRSITIGTIDQIMRESM